MFSQGRAPAWEPGPTTLFPTTVHTDNGLLRADHRFSDRDQFRIRYSYYGLNATSARGAGAPANVSYGTVVRDTNHIIAPSNVATLSPRTFDETQGQFAYDSLERYSKVESLEGSQPQG